MPVLPIEQLKEATETVIERLRWLLSNEGVQSTLLHRLERRKGLLP